MLLRRRAHACCGRRRPLQFRKRTPAQTSRPVRPVYRANPTCRTEARWDTAHKLLLHSIDLTYPTAKHTAILRNVFHPKGCCREESRQRAGEAHRGLSNSAVDFETCHSPLENPLRSRATAFGLSQERASALPPLDLPVTGRNRSTRNRPPAHSK